MEQQQQALPPAGTPPQQQQQPMAWDVASQLREEWSVFQSAADRMNTQMQQLARATEATRAAHQRVAAERDQLRQQVAAAEARLAEVQRIVQRYSVVQEPVIASDGFTYEKKVITTYLDECKAGGVAAVSQQTKEPLTDVVVPNQSLKKLVELLKNVKAPEPSELPPPPPSVQAAPPPPPMPMHGGAPHQTAPMSGDPSRLHPCVRVYGYCNYKESCAYAKYPYDACLSHLKGKCRFGASCHEMHVDFKGQVYPGAQPPGGRRM